MNGGEIVSGGKRVETVREVAYAWEDELLLEQRLGDRVPTRKSSFALFRVEQLDARHGFR